MQILPIEDPEINQLIETVDLLIAEGIEPELDSEDFDQKLSYFTQKRPEETNHEYAQRLDNYLYFIEDRVARAKVQREKVKKLSRLAKTNENIAKRLKSKMLEELRQQGISKLETSDHKVFLCENGGKIPVEFQENVTPDLIPKEYLIVSYEIDVEAVRKALLARKELEFAWLGERGVHLRIK